MKCLLATAVSEAAKSERVERAYCNPTDDIYCDTASHELWGQTGLKIPRRVDTWWQMFPRGQVRGGEKCELRCSTVAAGPFTAAASQQQRPGGETLGLELLGVTLIK